ncbi:MAG: hypothetical protein V4772_08785 [Pseudomonadota bacterium]
MIDDKTLAAPVSDEEIKTLCNAAGVNWIDADEDPDGYPGGFDMSNMDSMRKLVSSIAAGRVAASPAPLVQAIPLPNTHAGIVIKGFGIRPEVHWIDGAPPIGSKVYLTQQATDQILHRVDTLTPVRNALARGETTVQFNHFGQMRDLLNYEKYFQSMISAAPVQPSQSAEPAPPAQIAQAAPFEQADPLDTPLPCDVTVGNVTIRKGVALNTLVLRMKTLYAMAHGHDADDFANRTPEQRVADRETATKNLAAIFENAERLTEPVAQKADVLPVAVETCRLVGVKNGIEVDLGDIPIPDMMKAKDIIRSYFTGDFEDDYSDAAMAIGCFEEFFVWKKEQLAAMAAKDAT